MNLYLLDVSPLENDAVFKMYYAKCPAYRKAKIDTYKKQRSRLLSLGSEILIAHGMKQASIHDYHILLSPNGKPFEKNEKVHFGISHSGKYVIAAFSNNKIGVDIEAVRKINLKIAERFFCEDEKQHIFSSREPEREFLKLWTRKESILKAHGTGLSYPLSKFSTIRDSVEFEGVLYRIDTFNEKDYVVSVAHREAEQKISPEIITVSP